MSGLVVREIYKKKKNRYSALPASDLTKQNLRICGNLFTDDNIDDIWVRHDSQNT